MSARELLERLGPVVGLLHLVEGVHQHPEQHRALAPSQALDFREAGVTGRTHVRVKLNGGEG